MLSFPAVTSVALQCKLWFRLLLLKKGQNPDPIRLCIREDKECAYPKVVQRN